MASTQPIENGYTMLTTSRLLDGQGNAAVEDVAVGDGMLVRTASAASAGVTAGAVSDVPEAAQPANARESKAIIPHRRHTFIIAQPYIFTV